LPVPDSLHPEAGVRTRGCQASSKPVGKPRSLTKRRIENPQDRVTVSIFSILFRGVTGGHRRGMAPWNGPRNQPTGCSESRTQGDGAPPHQRDGPRIARPKTCPGHTKAAGDKGAADRGGGLVGREHASSMGAKPQQRRRT
jgi:hypothetical protein